MYMSPENRNKIWEAICDYFPTDVRFKVSEAAEKISAEFGFTLRTANQMVRETLNGVAKQEVTPDLPKQVKKVGAGWVLPSYVTESSLDH